ncbi:ribonuclease H-like domain-containing protein [Blyttiomyces helicus]|uniref:3'-5' exonuclease n=1 Tax=Blyttiomyces helicus TaxID=388810 RepID=A0A4P9W6E8_9FUNG|nr:ribonuclease H-like domain-containing protein [Blyttiomyces helicus]|eukprot:RKO86935.1 ribonuclease H-like domain-containing protein [Blyttiomyces helicus]
MGGGGGGGGGGGRFFHVKHMRVLPAALRNLLEDKACLKVGLGIQGDGLKLHRDFIVSMGGFLDLGPLATAVCPQLLGGVERPTLQYLVEKLLGKYMNKRPEIRTGDWEAYPLSRRQREYAANDAYGSYKAAARQSELDALRLAASVDRTIAHGFFTDSVSAPSVNAHGLSPEQEEAVRALLKGVEYDEEFDRETREEVERWRG